ncbi:hypothetical protein RWH43_17255 [Microbacterium sp. KSW2-21]|uniref:Uncharacterized protein n=1 Tax=Microbacterium algihabitans TaxID=3075992 RepID=A0ABU3S0D0_9MICO|nr:hypothetical protein [Microbacterium sp. KSW2-21]MDU0328510.1 hypothetical protein [Microbacterium sp. KSW2-21]
MTVIHIVPRQMRMMLHDYEQTWSGTRTSALISDRTRAIIRLYFTPTVPAVVFLFVHVRLGTVTPFLTSMSVFTALLFGLLTLIFNTAVTLRKDEKALQNAHGLSEVIKDLRAIVTYTIFVALALVITLALGAAFTEPLNPDPKVLDSPQVVSWWWTPVYVWLAVHMLLNLGDVLVRFRTAYNYLAPS